MKKGLKLEWVDPATLRDNPKNWRRHPKRQCQALKSVLKKVGWAGALLYNKRTKRLIDGHLRKEVSMESGKPVPVLVGSWTPKQEALILATLDPIAAVAEADADVLADLLKSVGDQDEEIQSILDDLADDAGIDIDAAGEVADPGPLIEKADECQRKWKVKRGDIWIIGSNASPRRYHRLMCGDSAKADDIIALMGRQKAALLSTDPPYLIDYTGADRPRGSGKDWSASYREKEIKDKEGFLKSAISAWLAFVSDNAAWFVWHASRTQALFEKVLAECGILIHQQIIWVKPAATFGYSKYQQRHEPCFFGWKRGNRPCCRRRIFKGHNTTVWEIDWEGKARCSDSVHPTQKPLEIFATPLRNHTREGDVCAEPFAGSGTQFVAAEQLRRLVYGMEIEPKFVAAILERLSLIGLKPRLTA